MKVIIYGSKFKRDISAKLESLSKLVTQHIIALYLFPDSPNRNHWMGEVWSFLNDVPLVRGRNKPPRSRFIYENTWGIQKRYLNVHIQKVIDKESDYTPITCDKKLLSEILDDYFRWISDKLSEDSYVSKSEVYDTLKDLGL